MTPKTSIESLVLSKSERTSTVPCTNPVVVAIPVTAIVLPIANTEPALIIRIEVIPPIASTSTSAVADLPTVEEPIAVRVAL